jgi:hypothetical protein
MKNFSLVTWPCIDVYRAVEVYGKAANVLSDMEPP